MSTATATQTTKPKTRRRFQRDARVKVPSEVLVKLADQGKSVTEIAREVSLATSTVSERLERLGLQQIDIDEHRKDPAKRWEELECKALDAIEADEVKNASVYQKSTIAAIARDKINSIKGSSGIVTNLISLVVNVDQRVQERLVSAGSSTPSAVNNRCNQEPIELSATETEG